MKSGSCGRYQTTLYTFAKKFKERISFPRDQIKACFLAIKQKAMYIPNREEHQILSKLWTVCSAWLVYTILLYQLKLRDDCIPLIERKIA